MGGKPRAVAKQTENVHGLTLLERVAEASWRGGFSKLFRENVKRAHIRLDEQGIQNEQVRALVAPRMVLEWMWMSFEIGTLQDIAHDFQLTEIANRIVELGTHLRNDIAKRKLEKSNEIFKCVVPGRHEANHRDYAIPSDARAALGTKRCGLYFTADPNQTWWDEWGQEKHVGAILKGKD